MCRHKYSRDTWAIAKMCAEKRLQNKNLKTQMRYGMHDVEIFTKLKRSEEGFRKANLEDFMETAELPAFDHELSWKRRSERFERRKPNYRNSNLPVEPIADWTSHDRPAVVRQRSITEDSEAKRAKRESIEEEEQRSEAVSTGEEEEVRNDSDIEMTFETPTGGSKGTHKSDS